jgi:glycosyltransferase involved in cell wall biosynthesis
MEDREKEMHRATGGDTGSDISLAVDLQPSTVDSSLTLHWITLSTEVTEPCKVEYLHQTFHILPTATRKRASTLFRQDRAAIRAVLEEIKPDLVHGWGSEDVYALAAVTSGYPNIVSMAGLLSHYVLKTKMHPRDYFQAALELFILRKADLITVETEWGRRVLRRRTKRPIELVEYGVRPHFYDIAWAPDPAKPVALFIGSIQPRKGIQDAVAAFAHPGLAGCELRIAGAGSSAWASELRSKARPNVTWLGQITPQQTAQELSRAWCLVLPTRCDTSPNVVKEARVISLPVITTSAGGQSDYIHDGENGFIVPCGQPGVLAERLERLLKNYDQCRAMGAARWEKARRYFRPERTADKFVRIYRNAG